MSWGSQKVTVEQSTGQMKQFLLMCRPHMLDRISVDELVARYRVQPKIAEYHLTIARQQRSGEAR